MEKSSLVATKICNYFGYTISKLDGDGFPYLSINTFRVKKLHKDIKRILRILNVSARAVACIVGQCIAMTRAIVPGKLLIRGIYQLLNKKESLYSKLLLD